MNTKEENIASLKDLMTVPPITAARHAAILLRKNMLRRMAEDIREKKRMG